MDTFHSGKSCGRAITKFAVFLKKRKFLKNHQISIIFWKKGYFLDKIHQYIVSKCSLFVMVSLIKPSLKTIVTNWHFIFSDKTKKRKKYIIAVTWPSLLKTTDPKLFSRESTKKYKKLIFVYWKVRDLHLLRHLMWPRWINFLVNDLSVFKFD